LPAVWTVVAIHFWVPGAFAGRDVGVAEQVMGTMELAHPGIRPPEKILHDIFSKEIRKQPAVSPYRGVTPVLYENGQKTVPVGISKGAGVGSYLKILRDRFVEARKRVHLTPSLPQIEAGNYSKGHVWMQGLDVTIESPKGSTREGKRPDGTDWKSTMAADYGDIRNYPRSKADGDNMDIFVGPHPSSEIVFVIDQYIDGKFDEHKCMCGFYTAKEARAAYQDSFDDKWKGLGDLTPLTMRQFKQWLQDGDTSKPIAGQNLSKIIKTAVDNSYLPPVIASAFDSKWVQDPAVAIGTGALRGTAIAGIIHAMRTLKRETLDEPKRDLNLTRDLLLGAGIGAGSGALLHYAPEVTSFVHDAIGHPKAAHIMDIPLLPFHAPAAVAPVISAAYGSALGGLKGLALRFKKKLLGEPEEEGELENHIIDGMQSGVNIGIASSMNGRNHVTDAASAAAIAAKGKTTAPRAGPKPVAKPTARNTFSPRIR
jgi:hypothetical protein